MFFTGAYCSCMSIKLYADYLSYSYFQVTIAQICAYFTLHAEGAKMTLGVEELAK